eukprot:1191145-Prorocentrum_minimum.AAC.2
MSVSRALSGNADVHDWCLLQGYALLPAAIGVRETSRRARYIERGKVDHNIRPAIGRTDSSIRRWLSARQPNGRRRGGAARLSDSREAAKGERARTKT